MVVVGGKTRAGYAGRGRTACQRWTCQGCSSSQGPFCATSDLFDSTLACMHMAWHGGERSASSAFSWGSGERTTIPQFQSQFRSQSRSGSAESCCMPAGPPAAHPVSQSGPACLTAGSRADRNATSRSVGRSAGNAFSCFWHENPDWTAQQAPKV